MKQLILLSACLLSAGALFAQKPAVPIKKGVHGPKCNVGGSIRDTRNHPVEGVKAFIYQADSSIIASGTTDATGNYETNNVAPGVYMVKLVYPSYKVVMVSGVKIKLGGAQISLKTDPPVADSSINYTDIVPKPDKKKLAMAKK